MRWCGWCVDRRMSAKPRFLRSGDSFDFTPLLGDAGLDHDTQRARFLLRHWIDHLFTCIDADANQSLTLDDFVLFYTAVAADSHDNSHSNSADSKKQSPPPPSPPPTAADIRSMAAAELNQITDRVQPPFASSISRSDFLMYHWNESRVTDLSASQIYELAARVASFVLAFKPLTTIHVPPSPPSPPPPPPLATVRSKL